MIASARLSSRIICFFLYTAPIRISIPPFLTICVGVCSSCLVDLVVPSITSEIVASPSLKLKTVDKVCFPATYVYISYPLQVRARGPASFFYASHSMPEMGKRGFFILLSMRIIRTASAGTTFRLCFLCYSQIPRGTFMP